MRQSLKLRGRLAGCVLAAGCTGLLGCGWSSVDECSADDCGDAVERPPASPRGCEIPMFDGPVQGTCIPYVDAGWHTALVKMAPPVPSGLHCPAIAPNAGLRGREVLDDDSEPRLVIACSVHPLPLCASITFACVPREIGYPPCVLQTGHLQCPSPYDLPTVVEPNGAGDDSTVCCLPPDEVP